MFTVTQLKNHLIGLGHGSTLNKVRNVEEMLERSASAFLLKCKPLESMRTAGLSNVIHDDVYNYSLPSDFGMLIDLLPQDNRNQWDKAFRNLAGRFDLEKATVTKTVSIEGSEGVKVIRINWRSRTGKVLNTMNSLTANGTWSAVGTASGVSADTIFKVSGSASIVFNASATGDGIQNNSMTALDLTDEDEVSDIFFWIYLGSDYAKLNSITAIWGNDLTANYWTGVAQTQQADGISFKQGWNLIKVPWSTATETGTVTPSTIDSFKATLDVSSAMSKVRIDNIIFSIGRNFDIKYYSKYLFKSATSGSWISKPVTDDDYVLIDNDTLPLFLMECLTDMAHQMEGTDSAFDINFARVKLQELYPEYKVQYPSMVKKPIRRYGSNPSRGRW